MATWNTREKNGFWKGGRTIASNGYVLIKVGKDHHLADSRGYVYEHRLVAEEILGRRLTDGEIVHHKDGNKQNNNPDNLQVLASELEHKKFHPPHNKRKENPVVECACGCGATFLKYGNGRTRRYVSGHNRPPRRTTKLTKSDVENIIAMAKTGKPHKQIAVEFGVSQPYVTRIANKTRRKEG